MALRSATTSRCGDGAVAINVHDSGIVISLASDRSPAGFLNASSIDARRTAYALLTAADELDQLERDNDRAATPGPCVDGDPPPAA